MPILDERTELREILINFTGDNFEVIEHGIMESLDDVRDFVHYLKNGDSDITGQTSEKIVDMIINYLLQ